MSSGTHNVADVTLTRCFSTCRSCAMEWGRCVWWDQAFGSLGGGPSHGLLLLSVLFTTISEALFKAERIASPLPERKRMVVEASPSAT